MWADNNGLSLENNYNKTTGETVCSYSLDIDGDPWIEARKYYGTQQGTSRTNYLRIGQEYPDEIEIATSDNNHIYLRDSATNPSIELGIEGEQVAKVTSTGIDTVGLKIDGTSVSSETWTFTVENNGVTSTVTKTILLLDN